MKIPIKVNMSFKQTNIYLQLRRRLFIVNTMHSRIWENRKAIKRLFTCNRDEISFQDETHRGMKKYLFICKSYPWMKLI